MVTPFYNAIKGTTAGTPGTGAFTPNAASSGYRAWSTVPTGWIGLVRYEDGSAWELAYSYWSGTTLSRSSTQLYDSSTGSQLTLTSAATAAMIVDASDVMSHLGTTCWGYWKAQVNSATLLTVGIPNPTTTGTAAGSVAGTNAYSQNPRVTITSATTANAQSGVSTNTGFVLISTTAGLGGFEFTTRFGASQLPTGPRLFAGMTTTAYIASTVEPSALVGAHMAIFGKDSTDTNIQFITKDGTTANKIDTGIALVASGWYEACVWCEPGSNKMYGLLIRLDTGAIFYTSTTTNVPASANTPFGQVVCGLNGTNTGTAVIMGFESAFVRQGS